MLTTRRRLASTISALADRSPRSMRLARATSWLGREQRHPSDLAEVEAQAVEAGLDREVELGGPLGLGRRAARDDLAVGVQHLDAQLEQVRVEVLDLVLRDVGVLQHVDDLVVREEALVAPVRRRVRASPPRPAGRSRRRCGRTSCDILTVLPRKGTDGRCRGVYETCERGPARSGASQSRSIRETRRAPAPGVLDESESHEHHPTAAARGPAGGAPVVRHQPLEGRRHALGEGDPHPPRGRRAAVPRRDRLLLRPRPRPEGRAHVALRGDGQRGDRRGHPQRGPARRGARGAHRASRSSRASGPCAARSRSAPATRWRSARRSPTSPPRRCTS